MKLRDGQASFPRRGFVFFMAILMIVLVATAMLAMSGVVSVDARRTLNRSMQAQLDQLLLAGAEDAILRLNSDPQIASGSSWEIQLPPDLAGSATLRTAVVSLDPSNGATLSIRATLPDRASEQTLHLQSTSGAWHLISADLTN
jgi:type II secretory pathway component PulK